MKRRVFGMRAAMFLSAVLLFLPLQAEAAGSTSASFTETGASAAKTLLDLSPVFPPASAVRSPTAPAPAPAQQNVIPFQLSFLYPSMAAAAFEEDDDQVMSPVDVDLQVSTNIEEEVLEPLGSAEIEVDDFFAKASEEVEKGKHGEFAAMANPIDKFIRYFTNKGRDRMELYLSRSGKYRDMMQGILSEYGLPEDLIYLALIESGFSTKAYSRARAVGPWQFIAGTGRRYGLQINWWVDERRDAEKSTHAAASYLKDLYGMFDSWPLAAAAYNAGEGKISRAISRYKSDDLSELIQHKYLKQETKDYVPKMLAAMAIAKEPEKYGFFDIEYEEPLNLRTVTVPGGIDLVEMARIIEVPYDDIREWNPELRRFCTPPNWPEYDLRLPADAVDRAQDRMEDIHEQAKVTFLQHNVRGKETLGGLAARYGTSYAILHELNGLRSGSIQHMSLLVIPVTGLYGSDTVPGQKIDPDKIMVARMKAEEGRRRSSYGRSGDRASVTVQKGQTLSKIARENGVSLAALAKANGLATNAKVKVGTRLKIPGRKASAQKSGSKAVAKPARGKARQGSTL
ncbi:MAG: transglycosylase SLT domain-containing protein [Syntrophorhabdaceae bacterium]|nr:transglycosylase SLT domain-containing protein [Syntrophorhabdaceae bacterium]